MCRNVFKEVLLTASKNQAKIQNCSEDCVQGGEAKNEVLRNIEHNMSLVLETKKSILGSQQVSCVVHYDILLQKATNITTKCDSYFIT